MGEHRLNLSEEVRTKNAIKYHTLKQLKIPMPIYVVMNNLKAKLNQIKERNEIKKSRNKLRKNMNKISSSLNP